MTERDRKFAIIASLFLTASVAANMALFQQREKAGMETAGIGPRTSWVSGPGVTMGTTQTPVPQLGASQPIVAPVARSKPANTAVAEQQEPQQSNTAEVIRGVQRELNTRGYEAGQPDGVSGLITRAAIFAFEFDNGLPLSGTPSETLLGQIVLGSSTSQLSDSGKSGSTTPEGADLVKTVKQQLAAAGYDSGSSGGDLTPEFARTIRQFEKDQKLTESGRISGPMMSRLLRLQSEAKAQREPSKPPSKASRRAAGQDARSGKTAAAR